MGMSDGVEGASKCEVVGRAGWGGVARILDRKSSS